MISGSRCCDLAKGRIIPQQKENWSSAPGREKGGENMHAWKLQCGARAEPLPIHLLREREQEELLES